MGLWPGVSITFRDGFAGLVLAVGGGARDELKAAGGPRFGMGNEREGANEDTGASAGRRVGGGAMRPGAPEDAR